MYRERNFQYIFYKKNCDYTIKLWRTWSESCSPMNRRHRHGIILHLMWGPTLINDVIHS